MMMSNGLKKPEWAGQELRLDPFHFPQVVTYAARNGKGDVTVTLNERGAVMATGSALLLVAHSYEDITGRLRKTALKICEAVGLMLFLLAGLSGLFKGRPFMANWLAHAGKWFGTAVAHGPNPGDLNTAGLLPLLNLGVGIEVLGGLTIILLYMLSGIKEEKKK